MTISTRSSSKQVETSDQGTRRMNQQQFHGFLEGSDQKFEKMQEQIGLLMQQLTGAMSIQGDEDENVVVIEEEMDEEADLTLQSKGMFRDPDHAAKLRQKQMKAKPSRKNDDLNNGGVGVNHEGTVDSHSLKHLKLTFPSLKEGGDAVEWLRDCEEYFTIFEVSDYRRSAIAAMHMSGTPRYWYKSFMVGRDKVTWQQFTQAFLARFGELETELVFDKFKKLQQTTTVEDYFDEFEKSRGQLLSKIPSLTPEYFLENFIGGLQAEVRGMIRLLEPSTLEQAFNQANQVKKGNTYKGNFSSQVVTRQVPESTNVNTNRSTLAVPVKGTEVVSAKPRPLTYSQREERRKKGLCFYCDEKFVKGHECKKPQNFLMIAEVKEVEVYEEAPVFDEDPNEDKCDWQEQKVVLAALGIQEVQKGGPMQFSCNWCERNYQVLIDGGSSLNLISLDFCKELGLQVQAHKPVVMILPNGAEFTSTAVCPTFKLKWQEVEMEIQAFVAELKDWHLILGIEWLYQLGNIRCNYQDSTMHFSWKGKEVMISPKDHFEIVAYCHQLSEVVPKWMSQIENSYEGDSEIQEIVAAITVDKGGPQEYYFRQGLLMFRGKWVLGSKGDLRQQVFEELHCHSQGGHSGVRATIKKVMEYFYWPSIRQNIGQWVRECAICQQNKGENVKYPGLLQPLRIPQEPWRDIAMDFITGLPKSKGNEVIWVVVDRFSRYSHFIALAHPVSAKSLALIFFEQIYKLHGLPETIVSDRDSLFLSEFWQNLFKLSGTRLNFSTAYHPQSDGSTERVNQCLEQYLRNMTSEVPKNWSAWLAAAEWWYNTTFHTTLNSTPFQVVYGMKPRHLAWQERSHTNISSLEELLETKQQQWCRLKELLESAQAKMKAYSDAKRSAREFQKGDLVYLKLQPYRQVTVAIRKNLKLAAKFYGPYEVIEKIGSVAYRLALPERSRVHPVFHVSQLKKAIGQAKVQKQLPQVNEQGSFDLVPLRQLETRSILRDHKMVYQRLVQWKGCSVDEATWEDEDLLKCNFPEFCGHEDMG